MMFIHIGEDVVVPMKDVIAIIDIESANLSSDTRQFLKIAEEEGFVKRVTNEEPKSFILTEVDKKSVIYFSPISSLTLCKRSGFIDNL
jgi:hypothetical protein